MAAEMSVLLCAGQAVLWQPYSGGVRRPQQSYPATVVRVFPARDGTLQITIALPDGRRKVTRPWWLVFRASCPACGLPAVVCEGGDGLECPECEAELPSA
jgi:hypothetical protein